MLVKRALILSILYLTLFHSFLAASDFTYVPHELLVQFAPRTDNKRWTITEQNQVFASIGGGTVIRSSKFVPGLTLVSLSENMSVKDAVQVFKNADSILSAQPNYIYKAISTFPNDPNFNQLWGMHNMGQSGGKENADIDAPEAWDIAADASDIIVAVIDSGVDYTHPDLADNMWINEAEANGTPGVDDDNNGFEDDVYGYDFCAWGQTRDSNPMDDNFHGTHCAGTVGAFGNNSEGVAGVCWNVRIMALKFLNYEQDGTTADAIDAIYYAIEMGANVLSNSWGGGSYDQLLKNAIEAADANGVLFIASAGNSGLDNDVYSHYPSSYDCNNIIAVLSTDKYDEMSGFSNFGTISVDLGAPGSDILSTFPTYETGDMAYYGYSTNYETISGTSMATPHVAGACALVWRMNPALSHLEVKEIILNTVDVIPELEDDPVLGRLCVTGGRLNLYNAIVEAGTLAGKQAVLLNKVDDVNGPVSPGDYITYTISFENTVRGPNDANFPFGDITNITIVDHLPAEVDYINPLDPNYDPNDRTYTWNIGTLQEDDSNSVELTVVVNNLAEPLGKITNVCVIEANEIWPAIAIEVTDVNCWGGDVIYVDESATTGADTGTSWQNAYIDMQSALKRARLGCGSIILVAEGTYKPIQSCIWTRMISFELVDNLAIYGGFPPGGGAWTERNPNVYKTILSGNIGICTFQKIDVSLAL